MLINLAKASYIIRELIQDQDLDIKFSGDKIYFTIYDCEIKTDGNTYFKSTIQNRVLNIKINKIQQLYKYVLIQIIRNTGFFKYLKEVVTLDELSSKDYEHLKRLSDNELYISLQDILNQIIFTHETPDKISKIIGVSSKFIRKLRNQSRHKILANAIINGNDQYLKSL